MPSVVLFIWFLMLCTDSFGQAARQNVTLWGQATPVPYRYSGSWSYVAPGGAEYGLVGGYGGTHVISLGDSTNLRQAGFIAGPQSNWREITVIGSHAYVVTEGGNVGMQVIDLSPLPDSVRLVTSFNSRFITGHIIMRDVDVDSPYVYVSGASGTGGVHIINVSNPAQPVQIGLYDPVYYIHDVHVRGNRMYASALGRGLDIVDISDKTAPVRLYQIQYPAAFTHSAWTTDDHKFLFVTDERDGLPARMWNIESLSNVHQVAQYSANLQSLVHNIYIRGRFAFVAHNTEGMRVVDVADPTLPVEVGFYDTFAGPSGGFNGLWSACPYLPSGRVLGGDRLGGLYVWRFNDTRASRLYGTIRNAATNAPIDTALILILETGRTARSVSDGSYKIGELPDTSYTIRFSANGFLTRIFEGVRFDRDTAFLDISLQPVSTDAEFVQDAPLEFDIGQNYPNPFNPETTFRYSLAERSRVTLEVLDITGQIVDLLVNEEQPAGVHRVEWNAAGRSSGVYIYRFRAGGFIKSGKMLLVR